MASTSASSALVLFLTINILLFTYTSACGDCPTPKPKPKPKPKPQPPTVPCPSPPATKVTKCPRDTLKLGVCADLLGLVNVIIGSPPVTPCCSLLEGLTNLEAAVCLCTALKANILGINLNVPISLSLLLNTCSKKIPSGFTCA